MVEFDEEIIKNLQQQIKEVKSFTEHGTSEFTVGEIIRRLEEENIRIPGWQRKLVWKDKEQSRFIESILLNIPIPYMFYGTSENDETLEIIDGRNRIGTLERFLSNELKISNDLESLTCLKGFTYQDLPENLQNRIKNRSLKAIVLSEKATEQTKRDIFKRINTSGKQLRPTEVRRGSFHETEFQKFIIECSENRLFLELCPITASKKKRKEPEELVLRFFTYSEKYLDFKHDVAKFLNSYVKEKNEKGFDKEVLKNSFERMLKFVEQHCSGIFKHEKMKMTPRIRFEAISVGTHLALEENPELKPKNFDWVKSGEFNEHIKTDGRNSSRYMRGRIEFVRDSLLKSS